MAKKVETVRDQHGRVLCRTWKCDCGEEVESYAGSDTECVSCDQLYNAFGQKLRPAYQWEENDDY